MTAVAGCLLAVLVASVIVRWAWVRETAPAVPAWQGAVLVRATLRKAEGLMGRAWLLSRFAPGKGFRRSELFRGVMVVYTEADAEAAALAAAQVRRLLPRVEAMLDGSGGEHGSPEGVWLAMAADGRDMAGFLGPRYGFNTLGAYWRGVILVLSPRAWLDTSDPGWRERFLREGPVVHELAHLVLDRVTLGRVPPWLDEGIAQYVEFALTGYEWTEGEVAAVPAYPLAALAGSFRELPDEALAYREAFLFIRFLVERRGEEALAELASRLRRGEESLAAAAAVARLEGDRLEASWQRWLREGRLDAATARGGDG